MTRTRSLFALFLTLILAWGSVTQAVAHSEMAGVNMVVLCDSTALLLDADGNPVSHAPCQHCLAAIALAVLADPALGVTTLALPRPFLLTRATALPVIGPVRSARQARAPPFVV